MCQGVYLVLSCVNRTDRIRNNLSQKSKLLDKREENNEEVKALTWCNVHKSVMHNLPKRAPPFDGRGYSNGVDPFLGSAALDREKSMSLLRFKKDSVWGTQKREQRCPLTYNDEWITHLGLPPP